MEEVQQGAPQTGVCTRGFHMECSGAVLEFLDSDVRRSGCKCWCHSDTKAEDARQDRGLLNKRTSRWAG